MSPNIPVVAIVGRTNVGKSSLFNAVAGRRISVVEDSPGVTRDRNYTLIQRFGFPFTLVDTGGLIGEEGTGLEDSVRLQAELAIEESDLVLAVFDGKQGPHPLDSEVVDVLRRSGKPVLWVVNKCEKQITNLSSSEFYALGIENLIPVSAAHQVGIKDLAKTIAESLGIVVEVPDDGLKPKAKKLKRKKKLDLDDEESLEDLEAEAAAQIAAKEGASVRVAILGRPNVGKSSLLNRLCGEERTIASDKPGTTRDSIEIDVSKNGQNFVFVDTAGLRKKARVDRVSAERYSNLRTLRALGTCDVAVLVLDATKGAPEDQDIKIASLVHERGRGLVVVVNKWDAIEKDHKTVKSYKDSIAYAFRFAPYSPIVFVSAMSGRHCPSILTKVMEVYESSKIRITTSELNKLLSRALNHRPPPVHRGTPVKLFFGVQTGIQPPQFVLFFNHPLGISNSYERYLKTAIRDKYPFEGSDIKFRLRKRTEKGDRSGARASASE